MKSQAHTLKPYLIQAVYHWCLDANFTPYLEVIKFDTNKAPLSLFQGKDTVVFNISKKSVAKLSFLAEGIQFKTKIKNSVETLFINYHSIKKIYAKELGHGMDFSTDFVSNESLENLEEEEELESQLALEISQDRPDTNSHAPNKMHNKLVLIKNINKE